MTTANAHPAVLAWGISSLIAGGDTLIHDLADVQKHMIKDFQLNLGKRLLGTWGGDSQPDRDYPTYCRLLAAGRVDLSPLMASRYSLEQANAALDDLEASRAIRPLIDMSIR